jgi:hypothetical protein
LNIKKELHVCALLVEHDSELDEHKLKRLYQKYWHLLKTQINPIGSNWLLDDATALLTTIKVMNGDYRWDIFITKEIKSKRLIWIDTAR